MQYSDISDKIKLLNYMHSYYGKWKSSSHDSNDTNGTRIRFWIKKLFKWRDEIVDLIFVIFKIYLSDINLINEKDRSKH